MWRTATTTLMEYLSRAISLTAVKHHLPAIPGPTASPKESSMRDRGPKAIQATMRMHDASYPDPFFRFAVTQKLPNLSTVVQEAYRFFTTFAVMFGRVFPKPMMP